MFPFVLPLGIGFLGLGLVAGVLAIVYPVLWVWMVIDGVLRTDDEYPGAGPNRKVLWVLGMVLVHPVVIAYFFVVFMRLRRTRQGAPAQYATAVAAPPVPQAPPYA